MISSPRNAPDYADYSIECQEALDLALARLIDQAIIAGWQPRGVYNAVAQLAKHQALAYEEDPHPAGE